ncbi:MAG: DUF87 domain-containing protein [Candidatus Diapherotrites archaeon]|nr:DUF87 domain-containing protein [Candidatus Diapherotrites archaeon]
MTTLADLLKPSLVKNSIDSIQLNTNYNRVISAVGYPRQIKEGWLNNLITSEGNFDISMHVKPAHIQTVLTKLNQELVKQKSDILSSEMKGIVNPVLQVQHNDTLKTLEKLQLGEERLFDFSLYVNARARSKKKLNLLTKQIESELNSMMIIPKTPYFQMLPALQSILPLQKDKLNESRNITSNALAACFPFTSSFLNIQEQGVMFGLNQSNNIPIILDQYTFTNYNGLIIGSSGAGKSFFVKLYILRNLMNNVKTLIIDPQGEYTELTKTYNGQLIEISRNSETIINPFDLMGRDFGEKMMSLMDLFKIMCGELTEVQKNVLDKCINQAYNTKGIYSHDPETWNKQPPIMEDLYQQLLNEKKTASRQELMTYEALENRIRIYARGTFSFINKQTNLDLQNDLISFNIADMPNQVKPVMMFLILDFIHRRMQEDKARKLLVIDEAWSLLRYGEQATYLFEIIKTARKYGLGMVIITQEANDLLFSKAGRTILANTAWKLLLRQEPVVMKELGERFNLNQEEQNFILTAQKGEGLLFAMNDRIPITVVASKKEYEIITTNPDEIHAKEQTRKQFEQKLEQEQMPKQNAFKLDKNYYPTEGLTTNEERYLKENNFKKIKFANLEGKNQSFYLHNPPSNQSPAHYFLAELIAEELRKNFDFVKTTNTVDADIEFSHNKTKYALEIQTEHDIQKDKTKLGIKIANLEKNYGKNWAFVVTQAIIKQDYEKYGATITRTEVKEWTQKIKSVAQTAKA